jgi:CRP-like cAMP-binding protein
MPKNSQPTLSRGNRLLARMPQPAFQRLLDHLAPVTWKSGQVLYKARAAIDYAYFPVRGSASALTVMEDGSAIEVATIGNEGVVGVMVAIGAKTSPNKVIVQVPGDALRMKANVFADEVSREGPLRNLLLRYQSAFLTQVSYSVACNGLHPVRQRCCRWLLMTQDRVQDGDALPLTHEFLAMMLGVRRSTVTEVLKPLQDEGFIKSFRGKITIVDRAKMEAACCECYRQVNDEYDRLLSEP